MVESLKIQAITSLKVSSGHQEIAISSFQSILEPTRVRRGCLGFRLLQEIGNARSLAIVEQWQTWEDFERYVRSREYRTVLETLELAEEPPEISVMQVCSDRGAEAIWEILGAERKL